MNYSPQCDSCKYFVTTDKSPKPLKRKFKSFLDKYSAPDTGYCSKGYCAKGGSYHEQGRVKKK